MVSLVAYITDSPPCGVVVFLDVKFESLQGNILLDYAHRKFEIQFYTYNLFVKVETVHVSGQPSERFTLSEWMNQAMKFQGHLIFLSN